VAADAFLKVAGGKAVVTAHAVDFLIPDAFFRSPPIAEDLGNRVDTIGLADLRVWADEASRKPSEQSLRIPGDVSLGYSERLPDEVIERDDDDEDDTYRVYRCHRGEAFIRSTAIIQNAEAVAKIFKAITGARLRGVGYTDLVDLFIEGSRLNGTSPGVTRGLLEAMISEMARHSDDPTQPLRIPLAAGKAEAGDFEFRRLKELPRTQSVFAGLGFEDVNAAVQSGLLRTRTKTRQSVSPMEDLLKL